MSKLGLPHERIQVMIELSGLSGLVGANYDILDKGLLFAFVDKWHVETNSFHLPIEEMTITLDDVSSLLHLPIVCQFYTYSTLDVTEATNLLVEAFRVDREATSTMTRHCKVVMCG